MSEMKLEGNPSFNIQARIIRANGKVENLGTIVGGTNFDKIFSYLRIKFANFKQNIRQLIK